MIQNIPPERYFVRKSNVESSCSECHSAPFYKLHVYVIHCNTYCQVPLSLWQGFNSVDVYLITTNHFPKPCYHIRHRLFLAIIDISCFVFPAEIFVTDCHAVDFNPRHRPFVAGLTQITKALGLQWIDRVCL